MSHKIVWIAAVISLVGLGVVGYVAMPDAKEAAPVEAGTKSSAALTVSTATAQTMERPDIIEASGPIVAWQEAIIGTEISGQRLVEVLVDVGDVVKKDQVLARFNDATLRAETEELKAAYAQAAANRKRALALKASGAMSAQEIDSYVHEATMSKARLDAKNLQLKYTKVTAPDDGVISARTATLGAVGSLGEELFRLIRQNRLEWRGELTAAQLAYAQIGQSITLTLPDGSPAEAKIRQISPSLDTQSRLATIYADIAPDSAARAGMYGEGRIERDSRPALVVPAKSVVIRDGYSYVFVLGDVKEESAVVAQKKIVTGLEQGGQIEVIDGLSAGEVVALQGAGFLNDGDIVRIAPANDQPLKSPTP